MSLPLLQGTAGRQALPDLSCRDDLDRLLTSFYGRAMTDPMLGPVFLEHLDLPTHLPRIGAFWEQTLLGTGRFSGRPMDAHRRLHASTPLTSVMFDRWLELWTAEIDAAHAGPTAERATSTAERIASAMQRQLSRGPALLQIERPRPSGTDRTGLEAVKMPPEGPTLPGMHRTPLEQTENERG